MVRTQLAPSPLWDSSSARDALSKSANSISSARLSTAAPASFCQPRRRVSSAPSTSLGGGDAPSRCRDWHAAALHAQRLRSLFRSRCTWRSCLQCPDRVCPGGPIRGLSVSNCRGQPHTTHSEQQLPPTPALVWEGHRCFPPKNQCREAREHRLIM